MSGLATASQLHEFFKECWCSRKRLNDPKLRQKNESRSAPDLSGILNSAEVEKNRSRRMEIVRLCWKSLRSSWIWRGLLPLPLRQSKLPRRRNSRKLFFLAVLFCGAVFFREFRRRGSLLSGAAMRSKTRISKNCGVTSSTRRTDFHSPRSIFSTSALFKIFQISLARFGIHFCPQLRVIQPVLREHQHSLKKFVQLRSGGEARHSPSATTRNWSLSGFPAIEIHAAARAEPQAAGE